MDDANTQANSTDMNNQQAQTGSDTADNNTQQNSTDQNGANYASGGENTETMIPKARFDEINAKRRESDDLVKSVVEELVADVPENLRNIIPDLPPADKIKWIRNAKAAGLFSQAPASSPDSKRPAGDTPRNFEGMSTFEILKAGFGNK